MKYLCVFCGSNNGARSVYKLAAQELGRVLAGRGLGLVYGGGNVGLMGTIADAILEAGGEAIGVIPQALVAKELAHRGLSQLHVVGSMHERKALMAELSDGFMAMPGGFGTFEEFCEVLTWAQLGFHKKPCGLLNVEGYYDRLIAMFDHAVEEQFVRPPHRSMVLVDSRIDALLDQFVAFEPIMVQKWVDREEL
ncbi:MAG: TIGR00730 family Rossman fold protein [Kovacikia sp.]